MRLTPKNWRDFQHYKDRNPPWIRLHRGLLDNKDFQRLPVESRALAPMLWLIASESVDGVIDAEVDDLAFRLRRPEEEIAVALRPLIERGFFVVAQTASVVIAVRGRVAVPETETETFTEADPEALTEPEAEKSFAGAATQPTSAKTPRVVAKRKEPAPSAGAWEAYSLAYERRYGSPPVRNATVNGQLAQFVGRISVGEAPEVARFYVGHQNGLYVSAMHPVSLLLRDAERLRTEWATGRQVTRTQGQQSDRTQTNANAFGPLLAAAAEKEAANG